MAAPKSSAKDVKDMEAITSGLTRAVLGDDPVNTNLAVNTDLAVETSTKADDMEAIANRLGQTILGEDNKQNPANLPAAKESAVEANNQEAELDPAGIVESQAAKKEDGIDALGTACGSLSLDRDDHAEAQREAQRLREQIQKEHEDKISALENAEAKRRADEEFDAFTRQFQAEIDEAKVKKMQRKARKEKDEEQARQLRLAAEAEAIARAERRAQQERRMQEEAQAAQAKRELDNSARLELSQIYESIVANTAIAQANAQEAQRQQQRHEAELIAQYHAAVARQAQLAELERRQQEELFLQQNLAEQHHAYPLGEQVSEGVEVMDTAPEGDDLEGIEMDTAPEMEASDGTEMDWEQVEQKTPLLAGPLLPLPQSMELLPSYASEPTTAAAAPADAAVAVAAEAVAPAPAPASAPAIAAPPAPANVLCLPPRTATPPSPPASAPATAAPPATASVLRLHPRTAAPPPPPAPAIVLHLPPRVATTPPPSAPIPSSPKTIKIVFKRVVPNPTLATLRPTISAWSPLGRLLSQEKSIPQVALPQMLGKRARENWGDGGQDRKKAKLEGEFRFEVGGKRKREDETFPGKKRALCNRRAFVVPCSRLIASANSATTPPTIPPTSTPPNALPVPALSSPSLPPPPPAVGPLPSDSHRGLAEAVEFYNDLPTLRAEIAWMRAQRLNTSRKETRGKRTLSPKITVPRTATPVSYWSRYRDNLSR